MKKIYSCLLTTLLISHPAIATEFCGVYKSPRAKTEATEPSSPATFSVDVPRRSVFGNTDGFLIPLNETADSLLNTLANGQPICVKGTAVYNAMGPTWNWYVYAVIKTTLK